MLFLTVVMVVIIYQIVLDMMNRLETVLELIELQFYRFQYTQKWYKKLHDEYGEGRQNK